jgi:repressor LexA
MFWKSFCDRCRACGKSPSEVVRETGLAAGSVTKWKNGTLPSRRSLEALAAYFSVEPQMLFSEQTPSATVSIPVRGSVAAGQPIEALTDVEDYEEIPTAWAETGEYAALRIHGDSMEPRMMEGDVVIVRIQPTVSGGDIAVVLIDDGGETRATCKRVKLTPDGILLLSFNPAYEPMFFSNAQMEDTPLRIFGRVVELRARFDR